MSRAIIIACVIMAAWGAFAQTPTPPMIPAQSEWAYVQAVVNLNGTGAVHVFTGRQYWDYTNFHQRVDLTIEGGVLTLLSEFAQNAEYQIYIGQFAKNQPICDKFTPQPLPPQNLFQNATYMGRQPVDGKPCDVWSVLQTQPSGDVQNITIWWDVTAANGPVRLRTLDQGAQQLSEMRFLDFKNHLPADSDGLFAVPAAPLCPQVESEPRQATRFNDNGSLTMIYVAHFPFNSFF
jgi:hypothetical protein